MTGSDPRRSADRAGESGRIPRNPDPAAPKVETPALSAPRGKPSGARLAGVSLPLPVVAAAVSVGGLAVVLTSLVIRPGAKPAQSPRAAAVDSVADDGALDIRWRSGRTDRTDCIGTFEVTRGTGTRAQLVAFVMDRSGAIIARDSTNVASAETGLLVDFRFRRIHCDAIDDWQLQATTPRRPSR